MKYYTILGLLFLFTWITLIRCETENKKDVSEEENTDRLHTEKIQIKSFWDTFRQAQKFRTEGNWLEAVEYYEKAIQIDSAHEDSWFYLGNMYLELGQYKEAESCWKRIIKVNPNSAKSHMQLGRLYLSFERPETYDLNKAKTEFREASSINRVITGPLMLLGHVALIEGDDAQAFNFFKSVIGSDTKNVEAHFLLGYLAWKNNNYDESRQWFDIATANAIPEKMVAGVLSEGDTKEGVSYLRPINVSIFHDFFINLDKINDQEIAKEMRERYSSLQKMLDSLQQ